MENPAKHLVYRPTAMQLLSILTTTVEVMPKESLLLLYVSAMSNRTSAGLTRTGTPFASTSCLTSEISPEGSDGTGADNMSDASIPSVSALTVSTPSSEGVNLGPSKNQEGSVDSVLTPEDLVHLTRRSLFLVIDADCSPAFMRLHGQELGRQAFALLSPTQRPMELGEASKTGNLLTMFLTGPLMAFCLAAGCPDPDTQQLVDLQVSGDQGRLGCKGGWEGGGGGGGAKVGWPGDPNGGGKVECHGKQSAGGMP
jgi:hypothetical protein